MLVGEVRIEAGPIALDEVTGTDAFSVDAVAVLAANMTAGAAVVVIGRYGDAVAVAEGMTGVADARSTDAVAL